MNLKSFASETQSLEGLSLWTYRVSSVPFLQAYHDPEIILGMLQFMRFGGAVLVISFGTVAVCLATCYILVHAVSRMQTSPPAELIDGEAAELFWEVLEVRAYNAIIVVLLGGFCAPAICLVILALHVDASLRMASWLGYSFLSSMIYLGVLAPVLTASLFVTASLLSKIAQRVVGWDGNESVERSGLISLMLEGLPLSKAKAYLPGAVASYFIIALVGQIVARHSYRLDLELDRNLVVTTEGGYLEITTRLGGIAADPRMSRLELLPAGGESGVCLDRLALGGGEYLSVVSVNTLDSGEYEARLVFNYLEGLTLDAFQVQRKASRFFLALEGQHDSS